MRVTTLGANRHIIPFGNKTARKCVDVEEHKTIIETANEGESIMATNVCRTTYFSKNRVRDMVFITTSAIYVK